MKNKTGRLQHCAVCGDLILEYGRTICEPCRKERSARWASADDEQDVELDPRNCLGDGQ